MTLSAAITERGRDIGVQGGGGGAKSGAFRGVNVNFGGDDIEVNRISYTYLVLLDTLPFLSAGYPWVQI